MHVLLLNSLVLHRLILKIHVILKDRDNNNIIITQIDSELHLP